MPRFFFHFSDGRRRLPDDTGREFASIRAARAHAVATLRDARAALCERNLRDLSGWSLSVTDAQGRTVLSLGFDLRPHEAVPLAPESGMAEAGGAAPETKKFFETQDGISSRAGGGGLRNGAAQERNVAAAERVSGPSGRAERAPKKVEKKF